VFRRRSGIEIKTPAQIELMRAAGLVVGETLQALRAAVAPGVTTGELDALAEERIRAAGAVPSFLGYHGFPGSICASVNDEIVHGIPGGRRLNEGDLISIDCGGILEGWHGDAALTVGVGEIEDARAELARVTDGALWAGIAAARLGGHVGDIGAAVEAYVREQGDYGIVEEYVGHGIGTAMHQPPDVPNYGRGGRGPEIVEGMVLAVEPMVVLGDRHTRVLQDDWTVVTLDGTVAAHAEHTMTVTPDGTWVLTALDGGHARLTALGVAAHAL
jgi:methionyl aminopeptidase